MSYPIAYVALNNENPVATLANDACPDLMELLKRSITHFECHLEEVLSLQNENLREVSRFDCRLANNIREEANFSEVLILYKISDVGL
jgi:hypothetical protein